MDYVLSEPPAGWTGAMGQLDALTLHPLLECTAARDALYLPCGLPAMVTATERALASLGVPPGRIVTECFEYGEQRVLRQHRILLVFYALGAALAFSAVVFALR